MQSRDDRGLTLYLRAIEQFPTLDAAGERELATRWQGGDRAAGDQLIQANLRYAARIARKYKGYGFRASDLIAEGNVGLMEALKRFEPERGLRFMTYAGYWVRALILSHVLKHFSMVGVGTGPLQSKMFFRLQRERGRLAAKLGEDEDMITAALARKFQTSEEVVRNMTERLRGRDASLDQPAYADGSATFGDLLPSTLDVEANVAGSRRDQAVKEVLAEVWSTLNDREQLIVSERLLLGEDGATLADLGRRLGLSRERVRQLEERVKQKLRRALVTVAEAA